MVEDVISRTTRRLKNLSSQTPSPMTDGVGVPSTDGSNLSSQAIVDGGTSQTIPPVETPINADDITVRKQLVVEESGFCHLLHPRLGVSGSCTSGDTNAMSNTSTNNAPSIIIPATSSESTEVSGGANSEKSLNPVVSVDFTEILSNVPEVQGDEILIVNRNGIGSVTSKSDEEKLLDKIMQASTAGDRDTAELLVRLYGKLTSSTSLNPPTNLAEMRSISSDTYPNEWTQSYAKWNGNHHNFLITIRDVYKHDGFVPWLIAHKANVDQIVAENGFLTGFRYDILVRQNAFAFPVPQPDGSQSVADISVLHTDIKDKVYELTRRFDELEYADNPYVYNCQKYNWDPNTGKPKSNKNKAFDNPGSNNGSGGNRGGGYKGRGDWPGRRNEQSAGDYVTANNNQTSWNDHGGDNGWGQKRKADTSAWGSGNGGYRNNDHNRNNNSSASSSQGPPRFNNKKDSSVKGNSAGKDAS
ncbi:hypothetical protein PSHT_04550, partial [Puccinia striiformis]